MGQRVFSDMCSAADAQDDDDPTPCHILAGWSAGTESCDLWSRIAALCQNGPEGKFLHTYLRYVKDRQFPMLIPQTRIGIAERRRPDFVALVPVHYHKYVRLAVELDANHRSEEEDKARDNDLRNAGYHVMSLRPANRNYLESVKRLVERINGFMAMPTVDRWAAATEVPVKKTEMDYSDIPF